MKREDGWMDMKITITQPAAAWYSNELELSEGDHLRFMCALGAAVRYKAGSHSVWQRKRLKKREHRLSKTVLRFTWNGKIFGTLTVMI